MSHFILWASVAFSVGSDKECLPHRTFEKVNMTLCVKTLCRCLEMSASFPRGGWRNAEGRELYQPGTAAQEPNLSSASLLFTYLQVRRGDSCRLGIGRGGSALLAWFRGSCWRDRHYQSILMAESEAHRWGVLLKLRHRRVRSLAPTGLAQCVCGNTRYLQQGELWSHTQRAWMQRGWEPGKTKSSPPTSWVGQGQADQTPWSPTTAGIAVGSGPRRAWSEGSATPHLQSTEAPAMADELLGLKIDWWRWWKSQQPLIKWRYRGRWRVSAPWINGRPGIVFSSSRCQRGQKGLPGPLTLYSRRSSAMIQGKMGASGGHKPGCSGGRRSAGREEGAGHCSPPLRGLLLSRHECGGTRPGWGAFCSGEANRIMVKPKRSKAWCLGLPLLLPPQTLTQPSAA